MSRANEDEEGSAARVCSLGDHELRHDEVTTCLACIARARTVLLEVVELFEALPDAVRTLAGISYDASGSVHGDGAPLPGGDAVVMLAGGKFGGVAWGRPTRGEPDGSFAHLQDQWESDPPSVSAVLAELEDDWRRVRRDAAAPYEPSVARCSAYLLDHLRWAAERHEQWVEQRQVLGWLHTRLQVVTRTDDRPEPAGAPCMHCGGRIVRRWHPGVDAGPVDAPARLGREHEGLADDMVCQGCGSTWRHDPWVPARLRASTLPASYLLAQRAALAQLPSSSPDLKVTLADAKRVLRGRARANLLALWVTRGVVAPVGRDVRGREVFRLGDFVDRLARQGEAC